MPNTLKSRLRLHPDYSVYAVDLGEGAMKRWLFNVRDGRNFKLNEVSFAFLELCDGTRTVEELAGEVRGRFAVEGEDVEADLVALAEDCLGRGVLVILAEP